MAPILLFPTVEIPALYLFAIKGYPNNRKAYFILKRIVYTSALDVTMEVFLLSLRKTAQISIK